MTDEAPEFTAYEINELRKLAKRSDYYKKCLKFILSLEDTENDLSDKQMKWAWGIKNDVKEDE